MSLSISRLEQCDLLRYLVERRLRVGAGGRLGAGGGHADQLGLLLGGHADHLGLLGSWPLVQHPRHDDGDHDRQREDVHDHI